MYTFFGGVRYWNYNTEILNFGNIGGFICLRSILFFGISSLLLIYVIVPVVFLIATKMSKKNFLILSFTIFLIFFIDEFYNLIISRVFDLPRASDIYKHLGLKYVDCK